MSIGYISSFCIVNVDCLVLLVRIDGRHPKLMGFLNNQLCVSPSYFLIFFFPTILIFLCTLLKVKFNRMKCLEMFEMGTFNIVNVFFFFFSIFFGGGLGGGREVTVMHV